MRPEEDRAYYDPHSVPWTADKGCGVRMVCWCGGDVEVAEDTFPQLVCRQTGRWLLPPWSLGVKGANYDSAGKSWTAWGQLRLPSEDGGEH